MQSIDLKHVARLARLEFKDAELARFESQVNDILKYVESLKSVPVEGVEATSHPLALSNVFREDAVTPSLDVQEFLKSAPRARNRFFEVPKVIDAPLQDRIRIKRTV